MALTLLRNQDPRYWLAKIVAEPDKQRFARDDFRRIVDAIAAMNIQALAALEGGFERVATPWSDAKLTNIMTPLIARVDAFNRTYVPLLKQSNYEATIDAPYLKTDAIEMLTFAAATIDQVRNTMGNVTWLESLQNAAGNAAESIYRALAGALKAALYGAGFLTIAAVAIGGMWAYSEFVRPRR